MTYRLPAEWEPQNFVQLTWPNSETDWADILDEVYPCYLNIAREVLRRENLLIVTPYPTAVSEQLCEADISAEAYGHRVVFLTCPINDTWARDHGFLTLLPTEVGASTETDAQNNSGKPLLLDFCFNGWGLKFAACHDNQINTHVYSDLLHDRADYRDLRRVVLEGGSVESDGRGTLLTTTSCLLAPNRNGYTSKAEAEEMLRRELGAEHILWLDHGDLTGDDTDGHIDTLARLCPEETIVYVQCTDATHPDYAGLQQMEAELRALRTPQGEAYRLLPLPMAPRRYDAEGQLLPATYANFLIVNGAVLLPVYGDEARDREAVAVLQEAFPGREVVGVNCNALIQQHGSLHCVTMQFPREVRF